MAEWMKIFFTVVFSVLLIIPGAVQVIVLRDGIPVDISLLECIRMSSLLMVFWVMYQPAIREIKKIFIHITILTLPFVLWLTNLVDALIYNYHPYDTLISAIGFSVVLLSLIQLLRLKIKDMTKKR